MTHAVVLANRLVLETGSELSAKAIARIRETLDGLAKMGIREVAVVDGRHADALRDQLRLHELPELRVRVLSNTSWKNLSGAAVLIARDWIEESDRCLVVRGERPLDEETLRLLGQIDLADSAADAAIIVATGPETDPGTEFRVKFTREDDTDLMT
ncbi:MAG: hypothetical protein H0T46_30820, partial [Deltaproteobacteria bacterium]|nr:hypothetical protein [Deltaproteobacteria bacterium]